MNLKDLEKELIKRRPGFKEHLDEHEGKRNLAVALVTLRKKAGLTQVELAKKAEMTQAQISKIESPTGPMPNTDTIRRYSLACGFAPVIDFYEYKKAKQTAAKSSKSKTTPASKSTGGGGHFRIDERLKVAAAPLI